MAEQHFAVSLKKSASGSKPNHRATITALGLSRFGKTIHLKDTPAIRGMLYKVVHLVAVETKDGPVPATSARARARALAAQN